MKKRLGTLLAALAAVTACAADSRHWADKVVREKSSQLSGVVGVLPGRDGGLAGGAPIYTYLLASTDGMVCRVEQAEYLTAEVGKLHNCGWEEP